MTFIKMQVLYALIKLCERFKIHTRLDSLVCGYNGCYSPDRGRDSWYWFGHDVYYYKHPKRGE